MRSAVCNLGFVTQVQQKSGRQRFFETLKLLNFETRNLKPETSFLSIFSPHLIAALGSKSNFPLTR
jgi:hypothetical protein